MCIRDSPCFLNFCTFPNLIFLCHHEASKRTQYRSASWSDLLSFVCTLHLSSRYWFFVVASCNTCVVSIFNELSHCFQEVRLGSDHFSPCIRVMLLRRNPDLPSYALEILVLLWWLWKQARKRAFIRICMRIRSFIIFLDFGVWPLMIANLDSSCTVLFALLASQCFSCPCARFSQ